MAVPGTARESDSDRAADPLLVDVSSGGEVDGEVVVAVPSVVAQLQSHPRWQLPGEFDFEAFLKNLLGDSRQEPDDAAWLARYQATDRSAWSGRWPDTPRRLPAQVLYHDAPDSFFAQWYRGTLVSWWGSDYFVAYAGLLFTLEDRLRETGREAELADRVARFNAIWEGLFEEHPGALDSPAGVDWPTPLGDIVEVLVAGPVEAAGHPALARLAEWTEVAEADAVGLPQAHFILGLVLLREDPSAAADHFAAVRAAVRAGAADWDHLAVQSWGWEGAAALRQDDLFEALELYQEGNLAGFSDLPSLIQVHQRMLLQGEDLWEEIAFTPQLLWSMVLFSLREPPRYGRLPMTEEKQRFSRFILEAVPPNPPLAPAMAMLAEKWGDPEQRNRWLAEAPEQDTLAWFLHYRDALHRADLEEIIAWQDRLLNDCLAQQAEEPGDLFALSNYLRVGGSPLLYALVKERAWMRTLEGELAEAVPWFLVTDHGMAVAIGEQLLTTTEMQAVAERLAGDDAARWRSLITEHEQMVWADALMARLAREGRWKEAAALDVGEERRRRVGVVLDALEALDAPVSSPRERAEFYFTAARAIRGSGISLAATKHRAGRIRPNGRFYDRIYPHRFRWIEAHPYWAPPELIGERYAAQAPLNHSHGRTYRYQAAELAWEAAKLLPENDARAAEILWHGGVWLMYIDPPAANRFYRALVSQHGATQLGQAAARIRWFPKTWPPEPESIEASTRD